MRTGIQTCPSLLRPSKAYARYAAKRRGNMPPPPSAGPAAAQVAAMAGVGPVGPVRAYGRVGPPPTANAPFVGASASLASAAAAAATAAAAADSSSILLSVKELFAEALDAVVPASIGKQEPMVTPTDAKNAHLGDYQCNNAMAVFGMCKKLGAENPFKNPRVVSEAILAALPENDVIAKTDIAGPGFINVTVHDASLASTVGRVVTDGVAWLAPRARKGKKVIIDYSSPNVAKEMHVGHLRSTIIGEALARTYTFCGAEVLALNHVGDWGTQFGMLIEHLQDQKKAGKATDDESVSDLTVFYKQAKARFDEEEEFKERARKRVTTLQSGDEESLRMWQEICDVSRKEFSKVYERLDVGRLEERGESFYNPFLPNTVKELMALGVAVESDGAVCVFPEGKENEEGVAPLIIRKSDGGFGYGTTDLASIRHRIDIEKGDELVYVTDVGQSQHFQGFFEAAKRAKWWDPTKTRVEHVGFGLVLGDDGKRFRTRSGDTVKLASLLDEAVSRCEENLASRNDDNYSGSLSKEDLSEAARIMGYGAVKYADLHNNRLTNYTFSYDRMLDLKGNTAVYLLYAHARIAQILVKAGAADEEGIRAARSGDGNIPLKPEKMFEDGKPVVALNAPAERALALHIARFPEMLDKTLEDLMPNRICDYLYELSTAYSTFYTECRVVGSEEEKSRLVLCESTARIMRKCLNLLGIEPLYRL